MNWKKVWHYLWTEWLRPVGLPLVVILAAKSALADMNPVPTGSMRPTILEGDVVFVNKLAYDLKVPFTLWRVAQWGDPARGDIVVCFSPDDGTRLVKRVAGVPGDSIELRQNVLFVNGARATYQPIDPARLDDLAAADRSRALFADEQLGRRLHAVMALPGSAARRDFGPVTVPAGQYLVLGDNRDNSRDSRFFGFVERRQIVGEAKAVVVSADLDRWLRPRFRRWGSALR